MTAFKNFLGKKTREHKKKLHLIEKILKKGGFETEPFVNSDDPYLFVKKLPRLRNLSFGGIRIYFIGEEACFRCQMRSNTQPFGTAYHIDVSEMFKSLSGEKKIAHKIIFYILKQVYDFFVESDRAEKTSDGVAGSNIVITTNDLAGDFGNVNTYRTN